MYALVLDSGVRVRAFCSTLLLLLPCVACSSMDDPHADRVRSAAPMAGSELPLLEPGSLARSVRAEQSVQMLLIATDPAPPSKGYNTFRVQLTDMAAGPYTPASSYVAPWMPVHRHGSSVRPTLRPGAAGEDWVIEDLSLFMGSHWQIYVFLCDGAEERCCDDAAEPCAETSASLRDTLLLETWIHD